MTDLSNNVAEFTWAPLIPLIGGFPLAAESAFNKQPVAIYSFDNIPNDLVYENYQNNTKGKHLEFKTFKQDDYTFERKINFIVGTPPLMLAA